MPFSIYQTGKRLLRDAFRVVRLPYAGEYRNAKHEQYADAEDVVSPVFKLGIWFRRTHPLRRDKETRSDRDNARDSEEGYCSHALSMVKLCHSSRNSHDDSHDNEDCASAHLFIAFDIGKGISKQCAYPWLSRTHDCYSANADEEDCCHVTECWEIADECHHNPFFCYPNRAGVMPSCPVWELIPWYATEWQRARH